MPINHSAAVQGSASSFRSTASYTNGVYHLNENAIKKMDENFKKIAYTDVAANLNNLLETNLASMSTPPHRVSMMTPLCH